MVRQPRPPWILLAVSWAASMVALGVAACSGEGTEGRTMGDSEITQRVCWTQGGIAKSATVKTVRGDGEGAEAFAARHLADVAAFEAAVVAGGGTLTSCDG